MKNLLFPIISHNCNLEITLEFEFSDLILKT